MALYRRAYRCAHMSQVLGLDEKAAEISRHFGGEAFAYMLTDEQHRDRIETGKRGLPYRFLVYSPESCALNWTAFFTREAMQAFLDAYGCTLDREPSPGESFRIKLPTSADAFAPLVSEDRCTPATFGYPNRAWLVIDASGEEDAGRKAHAWMSRTDHPWRELQIDGRAVDCGDYWRVSLR